MINILSYIGMNLQSEVCLWTLLGLLRTIFDATLFKVNANLKQVWQMEMPPEISLPVQRVLRTMVSGVMLAQCFTVYVYLASYIVLLYPVFLEERPTLVLPWLLLAAIRNFLCELTSLALGLGTCVLLGPARPPCIRFVIFKLALIMPAFYIWMLIFGYYHNLKMASAFKTFPTVLPSKDLDYGLELAVRRRRTKSLQGEDQLRKKLIASLYAEQVLVTDRINTPTLTSIHESEQTLPIVSQVTSNGDITSLLDALCPMSVTSNRTMSDIGTYEDWFGSEVVVPRDTDRILEQFVIMLLRIAAYLKRENVESIKHLNSNSQVGLLRHNKGECTAMPSEETDTPPLVGNTTGRTASYLRDYPHIFGKKTDVLGVLNTPESKLNAVHRSSSSQSIKSTKGVATETVTPEFNNLSEQGSRDILSSSHERKNDQNLKNIYKQIENEQVPDNSINSDDTGKIDINETRARSESKESRSKNKSNPSERILNINKYKRKDHSSNNNDDVNSDRSSNSEQQKK